MIPASVRAIAIDGGWTSEQFRWLTKGSGMPPPNQCSESDWQRLETLLQAPPGIDVNGWTYYQTFDTVVSLLQSRGEQALIKPPGLSSVWVQQSVLDHPYSCSAGGPRRWNLA